MSDEAAGRAGKCPSCGTPLVVPVASAPAPAPVTAPAIAVPAAVAVRAGVRFDAVGRGWALFRKRMGVWVLASVIALFGTLGAQIAFNLLSIPAQLIGGQGLSLLISLASLAVQMGTWGVLMGGMFRMAVKQVDGRKVSVGDMFDVGGPAVLLNLALAAVLTSLATMFGMFLLVIPGLILAGLFMLTLPLVVDGRLAALDAIRGSWDALKGQWLAATVFHFVVQVFMLFGLMLCGVGMLFTLPLYVLAVATLYRDNFPGQPKGGAAAPSAKPAAVAGRVPGWAWGVIAAGLIVPPALIAMVVVALIVPAVRTARVRAQQNVVMDRRQKDFQDAFAKLQGPGAANPKDLQDAFAKLQGPGAANPAAGRAPVTAAGPIDSIDKALSALKGDAFKKSNGLDWLLTAPPDDARHAEVTTAVRPLLTDPFERGKASKVLAAWATRDDVPALVAALSSDNDQVRRPALEALARVGAGDARAAAAVASRLTDPGERALAVQALTAIGAPAEPEARKFLNHPDRGVREAAAKVLGQLGADGSELTLSRALADLNDRDGGVRARALARLAAAEPDPSRRGEVARAARGMLADPDASTRAAAAKALGAWGDTEDVPALIAALDDRDARTRREALQSLGKLKDERAAAPAARLLADGATRNDAARALTDLGPAAERETLRYLRHNDAAVRVAACRVLQAVGTRASVAPLRSLAQDPRREVVAAAADALRTIPRRPAQQPAEPQRPRFNRNRR